jgi:hypothetical protein
MEYTYDNTEDAFLIFAFVVIIGFFIVLAFYFNVIAPFMKARDYIKMEMQRSDSNEYYYWKSELIGAKMAVAFTKKSSAPAEHLFTTTAIRHLWR